MYQKIILLVLLFLSFLAFSLKKACTQEQEGEIIIISERVGEVIDLEEREKFNLFRFAEGFQSATLFKLPDSSYVWKITCLDSITGEQPVLQFPTTKIEIDRLSQHIDHYEETQAGKYYTQTEEDKKLKSEKQQNTRKQSTPLRERHIFPITEVGVNYRLSPSPTRTHIQIHGDKTYINTNDYNSTVYMTSDLGLMKNMSSRYSFGASHFLGFSLSEGEFRGGLRFRARRWLSGHSSIDLSPGLLLWETSEDFKFPGFTGSLDFKIEEWIALTLTFEFLRAKYDERTSYSNRYITKYENDVAVYFGIKSGSKGGLIATIAAAGTSLIFLFLYLFYSGD